MAELVTRLTAILLGTLPLGTASPMPIDMFVVLASLQTLQHLSAVDLVTTPLAITAPAIIALTRLITGTVWTHSPVYISDPVWHRSELYTGVASLSQLPAE